MASYFSPTPPGDVAAIERHNLSVTHLTSTHAPSQPLTQLLHGIMSSSANQKQDLSMATQKEAHWSARNVTQKGSLTSDQVEKVRAWRTAAATGALLGNRHKPTSTGPSDGSEKIGAAKGASADSEWGVNLKLLDSKWGDNLILLDSDSEWGDNLILL
ncbi:hypothetical protein BDR22DRAFT_546753 [Usnea florida]